MKTESSEEEFFCLTPEDARSRNTSATSTKTAPVHHNAVNDTKIFSVAVESRKSEALQMDSMKVCDVDSDFTGRFAVVQKPSRKETMLEPIKAEVVVPEVPKAAPTQEVPPASSNKSNKKGKKNKKNKNKGSSKSSSSADEFQVEEDPMPFTFQKKLSTAQERETTPLEQEMTVSFPWRDDTNDDDKLVQALVESTQDIDLMSSSDIRTDEQPQVEMEPKDEETAAKEQEEEEVSTHSDEFQEITNRKASDDTTEDDDEEEEEESESEPFKIDHETSAKPDVPFWVDDILKDKSTDNAILSSIEKAEQKYDIKKKMSQSTGFVIARSTSQPATLNSESVDSSEDDLEFKPVSNGRRRKKQPPQLNLRPSMSYTEAFRSRGSSFADSESSFNGEEVARDQDKEGWSFEADDLDVNKFLAEAASAATSPPVDPEAEEGVSGEKPQLEDVFKFDSEIAAAEVQEGVRVSKQNAASLEDLNEALMDDDDDEANNEKMTSSLNVTFDEDNLVSSSSARESMGLSTSIGETTDSSVGNSPNPKKNKGKKKKKKRF